MKELEDGKIIGIVSGQIHMLSREQSKLCLSILLLTLSLSIFSAWFLLKLDTLDDILSEQTIIIRQMEDHLSRLEDLKKLEFSSEISRNNKSSEGD